MKPYVVKQGDYLIKLAHHLGFDRAEVWNHEKNSELRERRGDGGMLVAGDVLFVPDEPKAKLPFKKEAKNRYVARVPRVPVTFVLASQSEPLADEPYRLEGFGDGSEQRTDAEGRVTFEAPVHLAEVTVVLPKRRRRVVIKIGALDPIDEPSGLKMRLEHLGFYGASVAGEDEYDARDDERLAASLRAFQGAHGIPPSGRLDDATRSKLLEVHGS